jgi:predicted component of type VI protein secretion system
VTVTCPAGHESATDDYCDVCGVALASTPPVAAPPPQTATAGGRACANCGAPHEPGDVFCEVCGLDFATGELPQPPPPPEPAGEAKAEAEPEESSAPEGTPASTATPAPGDWYVVVEPDHDWFERNEAEGTTGSVSFPDDTSPWQLTLTGEEVLVGRRSEARTAQPDLELEDPGVSRRHAMLRRQLDGTWSITDEESTNGTWIDSAADPIEPGEPTVLTDGSTVHIGAFTRLTIRKA